MWQSFFGSESEISYCEQLTKILALKLLTEMCTELELIGQQKEKKARHLGNIVNKALEMIDMRRQL